MTDEATQPEGTEPESTEPSTSGSTDPTGVEGANPALDDTGNLKAAEVGEAPQPPENLEDLDLTPAGLADEPAEQEDPDSPVEPGNS
ncbi:MULTISPECIES: hypothetical protein [unclassified Arthrobacter]|uniref:hypothetical protein n=1 Tax=unclassified Arthrobacter TaxID=235627 RepID=UPI002DFDE1EB|nr:MULTISPECIES: hypothetical protein [unclassified Arthrobacter]MEC5189942.1 hypothetical protein [Arthrobacter sp. MP_M4]MEC5201410.1 hypothetical protein [Arthrobacter sp. MP_M7]